MSEWVEATLGDVVALDVSSVEVKTSETYKIVGVLNRGRGLLYRDPIQGTQTTYKKLNRIRPGQVVYSRLKAFEGAITVVPTDAPPAFASPEFPTFTCGPRLLPEYFSLVTSTPALWTSLQSLSTGMGGRRERVKPSAFLTISILLPPLPIQERIVHVIRAVDDHIAALTAEADAAASVRTSLIDQLLIDDGAWRRASLGELGTFIRGRRFTKNDYVDSGLGCIHYGQIYTDYGALATATVTYVPEELRGTLRLARRGDLVIAATSENVEDVCKAVAWLGDDEIAVHDDCLIFRHDLDPAFASYLFASSAFQQQKARYISESKVVRVAAANLAKIVVPVPPHDLQARIGTTVRALDDQIVATHDEIERLRGVRASLLTALLERDVEIEADEEAAA